MQKYYYLGDNSITEMELTQKQHDEWQGSGYFFNSLQDAELQRARDLYKLSDYAISFTPYTINGDAIYFNINENTYKVYNGCVFSLPMTSEDFIYFVQNQMYRVGFKVLKNTKEK